MQGRVDEAERFALAARETVGPHDISSLASTAMSLGLVRAAQGRDEEAEELLRQAYDTIADELRMTQCDTLKALTQFLRDRGRDDEAAELDAPAGGRPRRSQHGLNREARLESRATRRSRSPSAGTSVAPA